MRVVTPEGLRYLTQIPLKRIESIEDDYDAFMLYIAKIQKILFDRVENSLADDYNLSQVYAINNQLENWLNQSGYERAYTEYILKIDKLKSQNIFFFEEMKKLTGLKTILPAFKTIDITAINALRNQMFENYSMIGTQAVNEIRDYTLSNMVGGKRPFNDYVDDLKDLITGTDIKGGSLKKHSYTYANTSAMQYDREQNARLAKNSRIYKFLYMGGSPIKTSRPFCIRHFGKKYTRDEIDKLHNPISTDSYIQCGGWNCRHEWIPWPL